MRALLRIRSLNRLGRVLLHSPYLGASCALTCTTNQAIQQKWRCADILLILKDLDESLHSFKSSGFQAEVLRRDCLLQIRNLQLDELELASLRGAVQKVACLA